jgi:transposase
MTCCTLPKRLLVKLSPTALLGRKKRIECCLTNGFSYTKVLRFLGNILSNWLSKPRKGVKNVKEIDKLDKKRIDLNQYLFAGVDVHRNNHAVSLTDAFGQELAVYELANNPIEFADLAQKVLSHEKNSGKKTIFGLEDTAGNGYLLATFLLKQGFTVKEVTPTLTAKERKKNPHRDKSDRLDAVKVAKALRDNLEKLTVTSNTPIANIARKLRALVNERRWLTVEQTRLKNQLHMLLHQAGYGEAHYQLFSNVFGEAALAFWDVYPTADLAKKTTEEKIRELVVKHSHRRLNGEKSKRIWSIIQELPEEMNLLDEIQVRALKRKLTRLKDIVTDIKYISEDQKRLLEELPYKLTSIPGCDVNLASRLLAYVGDIEQFETCAKLAKYAGCAPQVWESGETKRHRKGRSGNRQLNLAVHHIALSQIGRPGNTLGRKYYERKIKEGKSKKHALTCLKRQLIKIIYVLLKTGKAYSPIKKEHQLQEKPFSR